MIASIFSNPVAALLVVAAVIVAVSFLPGFLASLVEKTDGLALPARARIRNPQSATPGPASNPYAAPATQAHVPITPYGQATCLKLESLGFAYQGLYYDRRRGIYKLRYDFWLAPDHRCWRWWEAELLRAFRWLGPVFSHGCMTAAAS